MLLRCYEYECVVKFTCFQWQSIKPKICFHEALLSSLKFEALILNTLFFDEINVNIYIQMKKALKWQRSFQFITIYMFRLIYGRKVRLLTIYSIICPLAFENKLMENLDKIKILPFLVRLRSFCLIIYF